HHPDAVVTVDQVGTYDFAWTEVNSTCQSTDIIRVIFHPLPDVSAGNDTILCEGGTVQLRALGTGSFYWMPEDIVTNPDTIATEASPLVPTNFIVTLTDQYGCVNSDTVQVDVWDMPVADAGPDRILEYLLETEVVAADLKIHETGLWTRLEGTGEFSDPDSSTTTISGLTINDDNIFLWKVTNGVCPADSDLLVIRVNDLVIPTLITPNGDPYNEYFELRGIETLGRTELIVFDRRGAQVYKSTNYHNDWNGLDYNGNPLPDDTYFYVIKSQNGKSLSGFIVIRR
ncbi:MAG: gliding motility-associated C-terminal domain-containing protein, partial [Bacteroidales bacterium]|nr:gliding motility-associated C-terminal domain-containing protein [Bacteroidales bacterium]